jgi:hypothetical protein
MHGLLSPLRLPVSPLGQVRHRLMRRRKDVDYGGKDECEQAFLA